MRNKKLVVSQLFDSPKTMKFLSCCFFLLCFNLLVAQVPDTLSTTPPKTVLKVDSTQLSTRLDSLVNSDQPVPKKKNFLGRFFDRKDYPNPKKALYLSLLLPGSGQIYNKHYWKAPIVYGAYTFAILNIRNNRRDFKRFRDARIAALDEDPLTVNNTGFDATSLRSLRDAALTQAETGFLILLVIHAFQAADAFVFAHLKTFEVSEDLSLRISPQMGLGPQQQWNAGVYVAMSFSGKGAPKPHPF